MTHCRRILILILIMATMLAMVVPSSFAAPVAPVAIGESAGLLAALVASVMGVDYTLSTVDYSSLNSFFSTSILSNPIWASRIYGGLATLNIGLDALNSLSSFSSTRITSDSIPDNSSGSLDNFTSISLFGIPFNRKIGSSFVSPFVVYELGPGSSGSFDYGPVHCVYSVDNSNRFYCTCTFQGRSTSRNFYMGPSGSYAFGFNWDGSPSSSASFGQYSLSGGYWNSSSLIGNLGIPVSDVISASYSSSVVDTSATSGLPSTGGMTITFASNSNSIPDLLQDLLSAYRSRPSSIDVQIVDDAGFPIDYENTIANEPYSSLAGDLGDVQGAVQDVHGTLGGFASAAQQAWTSIDTNIGNIGRTITENLGLVGDRISSAVGTASTAIVNAISAVGTAVSDLAGTIAAGDSNFFNSVVSSIAAPFEPIFAVFRSSIGIWRYVVAWVGNVSAPFTWSLSALGSAGSYFLSPLYAVAAAAVVIAIYRRFGR